MHVLTFPHYDFHNLRDESQTVSSRIINGLESGGEVVAELHCKSFNEAETKFRIAHNSDILLINSNCIALSFQQYSSYDC